MAKVGAQRAATLTGKSKSTIQRAMKSGKISFDIDANGRRVIDVSELERAFGLKKEDNAVAENTTQNELDKAKEMLEMERMKMRIRMLEHQLDTANQQINDLKGQRDQWQKQAQQTLLTSQYSQKQAEELKEEIRQAKQRRQKRLEERMKKLQEKSQNENEGKEANVKSLWGRLKSRKKAA